MLGMFDVGHISLGVYVIKSLLIKHNVVAIFFFLVDDKRTVIIHVVLNSKNKGDIQLVIIYYFLLLTGHLRIFLLINILLPQGKPSHYKII